MVLGRPAALSKEKCSYAGADWLCSAVSRRVARGQLQTFVCENLVVSLNNRKKLLEILFEIKFPKPLARNSGKIYAKSTVKKRGFLPLVTHCQMTF